MIQYDYRISFNTPAFLGNSEQTGQWRTPPLKALLRQWWRVAFAAGQHASVDVETMRREEGLLFGVAADGREGSRKSRIRIRLDRWDTGKLKTWDRLEQAVVHHPEVEKTRYKVGPHAYLGFGPLDGRHNTRFSEKVNAAIQAGETATLSLAFEETHRKILEQTLWLISHYGTLGGRSRNGWGSLSLTPSNNESPALDGPLESGKSDFLLDWRRALKRDWPHGIGRDERPLIWRTSACDDWKFVMRQLAEIKIGLRTQFKFLNNMRPPHQKPLDRHWLSYPITRHSVRGWGHARLPNSLRFKVRHDGKGKPYGVVVHVPCAPPAAFSPDLAAIEQVWSRVHRFLDDPAHMLTRIPA
ncbi:RAMP superfamily CRISPR-associated protein [Thioalkalicoccus limnaeus]|uniref:RAMP superfamily CRISPR-associated protein n=1 Tax=Thioalkalicoccus limnaeus TaxID=120681 RepID=A0ABV4BGI2_9GAMM